MTGVQTCALPICPRVEFREARELFEDFDPRFQRNGFILARSAVAKDKVLDTLLKI